MIVSRRGILLGLGSILAAPAIVHVGNLIPIKALEAEPLLTFEEYSRQILEGFYKDLASQINHALIYGTGSPLPKGLIHDHLGQPV